MRKCCRTPRILKPRRFEKFRSGAELALVKMGPSRAVKSDLAAVLRYTANHGRDFGGLSVVNRIEIILAVVVNSAEGRKKPCRFESVAVLHEQEFVKHPVRVASLCGFTDRTQRIQKRPESESPDTLYIFQHFVYRPFRRPLSHDIDVMAQKYRKGAPKPATAESIGGNACFLIDILNGVLDQVEMQGDRRAYTILSPGGFGRP